MELAPTPDNYTQGDVYFDTPMSERDQYYREMAAEAEAQANRASTAEDKAAWFRLVNGWLSLLPKRPLSPSEEFEARARAVGTHQDVSDREQ